jgi:hypothetical protein
MYIHAYVYIYIYVYIYLCIYLYTYVYTGYFLYRMEELTETVKRRDIFTYLCFYTILYKFSDINMRNLYLYLCLRMNLQVYRGFSISYGGINRDREKKGYVYIHMFLHDFI